MTKKEFIELIEEYPDNAEIVVSNYTIAFNLMGKKSPTSIGGAMNCPIIFQKTK